MGSIWVLVVGIVVLNTGIFIIGLHYDKVGYNRAVKQMLEIIGESTESPTHVQ